MRYDPRYSFRGFRAPPARQGWFPRGVSRGGSRGGSFGEWSVLTPLWSRWLSTSFTLLVLTQCLVVCSLTCSFFNLRWEVWGTLG
jgi:hypothetical protein